MASKKGCPSTSKLSLNERVAIEALIKDLRDQSSDCSQAQNVVKMNEDLKINLSCNGERKVIVNSLESIEQKMVAIMQRLDRLEHQVRLLEITVDILTKPDVLYA